MASAHSESFDRAPWKAIHAADNQLKTIVWHKSLVPYESHPNALQTVDIWVPCDEGQTQSDPGPSPTEVAKRSGIWMIYIHGGAWRDPMVTSASFEPTVHCILNGQSELKQHIAGLASISYSLSPHPNHPTSPAPVPGPGVDTDPSRSAKHPDHIRDTLSAIKLLHLKFNFGSNYILTGHSCGATLAFQVVMDRSLWHIASSPASAAPKPIAIVGLNGLYDLPNLIENPGEKHEKLSKDYEGFVRLAFGNDKNIWHTVSPTSVSDWGSVWAEGKTAVLVQSHEDTLVPYSQTDLMFKSLRNSAGANLRIGEMEASGDHNNLWEKGSRIAEILLQVLAGLI